MRGSGGSVIRGKVARIAAGGQSRVLIIDVTGGTRHRGVFSGQRKFGLAVIERRAGPIGRRMAQ